MNRKPCLHPGCTATLHLYSNHTGYCREHVNTAYSCQFCGKKVAAYNYRNICNACVREKKS
jgi:ribosomal protein S14